MAVQVFLVTIVGQSSQLNYDQKQHLGSFLGLLDGEYGAEMGSTSEQPSIRALSPP
jgi:hypothetical protein